MDVDAANRRQRQLKIQYLFLSEVLIPVVMEVAIFWDICSAV
jgi:hypothetical protein